MLVMTRIQLLLRWPRNAIYATFY